MTYDVATDSLDGKRRLRRVAQICQAYGQRVQKSVFECIVNAEQLEMLQARLAKEVSLEEDSLRIYHLREPRKRFLRVIGREPEFDLHDTLVV